MGAPARLTEHQPRQTSATANRAGFRPLARATTDCPHLVHSARRCRRIVVQRRSAIVERKGRPSVDLKKPRRPIELEPMESASANISIALHALY